MLFSSGNTGLDGSLFKDGLGDDAGASRCAKTVAGGTGFVSSQRLGYDASRLGWAVFDDSLSIDS